MSEKERKQRLGLGIFFAALGLAAFLTDQSNSIVGATGLLSAGFIANYFTCFCGTKKAIAAVKNLF